MIDNDINNLEINFKKKVQDFLDECKQKWFNIMIIEWLRTLERQKRLYEQWRTRPGKKITWTLKSKHINWLAVDIVFKDKHWNPTWVWDYNSLIEIWKKHWLKNLAPTETCHFEDDIWEYEKMFKNKYWKWTIFNDIDWGLEKCIDKNWELNAKEFFYFVMIWLERTKK